MPEEKKRYLNVEREERRKKRRAVDASHSIVVHHLKDSRSQRILWLLEELNLPYSIKHYERQANEMAPAELKEIHPLGKSPAISDGDQVVTESACIVDFLIDKYGGGKFIPKRNTPEYQRYNYWMHFSEASAVTHLVQLLVFDTIQKQSPYLIYPIVYGLFATVRRGYLYPEIKKVMDYVERELDKSTWLVGDNMTGADVMMSFPVEAARAIGRLPAEKYPNCDAFLKRIREREAYQKALQKGGEYAYAKAEEGGCVGCYEIEGGWKSDIKLVKVRDEAALYGLYSIVNALASYLFVYEKSMQNTEKMSHVRGSGLVSHHEQKADDMVNWTGVKRTIFRSIHWILIILTVFVLISLIVGSIVIFVASIVQDNFPNVGENFPSPSIEHYGYNFPNTDCSNTSWLEGNRPLRFKFFNTSANDRYRYQYCAWPKGITAWRAITSFISFIVSWILVGVLGARSVASDSAGIWQDPRRVLKFISFSIISHHGT
ncbi:glutathione S-transferase [Planoprotostelium fungivorum]|uniref:glutathione transferase n=1 Tax=Planoprotostelium fungivorum TaxID=1890364 RepID=A0A2P6N4W1_9EUKA|nr:glutathione S-transferase [Planoprotostelium fungivorum]